MDRLFPRTYRTLRWAGHSEASARRMLLDARRGDRYTLIVVRATAGLRRTNMRELCELMALEGLHVVRT